MQSEHHCELKKKILLKTTFFDMNIKCWNKNNNNNRHRRQVDIDNISNQRFTWKIFFSGAKCTNVHKTQRTDQWRWYKLKIKRDHLVCVLKSQWTEKKNYLWSEWWTHRIFEWSSVICKLFWSFFSILNWISAQQQQKMMKNKKSKKKK